MQSAFMSKATVGVGDSVGVWWQSPTIKGRFAQHQTFSFCSLPFFAGAPLRKRGAYSLDILVHFLRYVDTTRGPACVWRDFSSPRPLRITVASTALITL